MKILAIETTDQAGSVALLDGSRIVSETRLDPQQRSAQWLAPAIRDLLEAAVWLPNDIRLIAVAIGPGSFTGLRVGLTTAKTFAYAVGCPVVAVPTLEVIAIQSISSTPADVPRPVGAPMPTDSHSLLTILDAGRQQVFSARFAATADGRLETLEPTALVEDVDWLARLKATDHISGPGLKKFAGRLPSSVDCAAPELWAPRASTVGMLGRRRYESGQRDDPWRLVPQYHRASAAEEKLASSKS